MQLKKQITETILPFEKARPIHQKKNERKAD